MDNLLVSICCLTYNHKNYIIQALDSFLQQKTNFEFEILIHDDASKDGTMDIIREYEVKYLNIIKPLYEKENQWVKGRRGSAVFNFPRARGKYIALCEGDDHWTDPLKLQKQVDFLESNRDYAMVATDIILVDKENKLIPQNNIVLTQRALRKPDVNFFDLLQTNLINTLTVCVRTDIIQELANEVVNRDLWFVIDKWFWLNIAMKYKIRLFDEKTAAYRIHQDGISHNDVYMSKRIPLIRYDVVRKFFRSGSISGLDHQKLSILADNYFILILSKYLGLGKKMLLIGNFVMCPKLFLMFIKITIKRALNKLKPKFQVYL